MKDYMRDFKIIVPTEFYGEAIDIEVDLTDPAYEKQVLSAAGRILSLRRREKPGPKARPVICPECGEEIPTKHIGRHRREKHERPAEST